MKQTLFLIFLSLFLISVSAQRVDNFKITGSEYNDFISKNKYKYPQFSKAKIYFRNGEVASARVNYDYLRQEMKYIGEKQDTLIIANESDIDYMTIGTDSIFYDNGYYEWMASSGTGRLACRKVYKIGPKALVGAFGTSSPAKNVEAKTMLLEESSYNLAPNEEITITKETTYYISNSGNKNHFVVATKNNFDRLFPKKNVSDFIKENNLSVFKEQDLVDIMVHISK